MSRAFFSTLADGVGLTFLLIIASTTPCRGDEDRPTALTSVELRDGSKIWSDNRFTPDQPFPARVIAVLPSWVGYHLLLEEIGDKGRLCLVQIEETAGLEYRALEKEKEQIQKVFSVQDRWIYLNPGIEINRFSWSIGAWKLGRVFGGNDQLLKIRASQRRAIGEQHGAGQTSSTLESESRSDEKPKPEPKDRR